MCCLAISMAVLRHVGRVIRIHRDSGGTSIPFPSRVRLVFMQRAERF
jgi:hypothetical protein